MRHIKNNDNSSTPMFMGLKKTTRKHGRRKKKVKGVKMMSDILNLIYFNE
jgi:hypothetical protein